MVDPNRRVDEHALVALEVLERRRVVVSEIDFRRIEHVEHHQVVAEEAQDRDRDAEREAE